nr:hypothetical protein [Gracilaria edulis]
MKLNIHVIIHPIIQQLAYKLIYTKSQKNSQNYDDEKTLGMLIMYEIFRKWLTTNNIYIKKVDILQEKLLSNELNRYLIISNIIENHNILSNIKKILPQTDFKHISLEKKNKLYNWNPKISMKKIIIFEKFLQDYKIMTTIKNLEEKNKINLTNVKVVCITCNSKILYYIARRYPKINVYTTKIV